MIRVLERAGFESDVYMGDVLIDMYAKCGNLENARQMFDKMSQRDVVSWTAMIAGYAQNGHTPEALTLFNQMLRSDAKPNSVTIGMRRMDMERRPCPYFTECMLQA